MATFYSEQVTAGNRSPAGRGDTGKVKVYWGEYVTVGTEAQDDIIEMVDIPAGSLVIGGGITWSADCGTCTLDVGITGGTVDAFVDGANAGTAAGGAMFIPADLTDSLAAYFGSADSIDVEVQTATGTLTAGVTITVYALVVEAHDS